jgi:phytoene dehydrogenase-like protein
MDLATGDAVEWHRMPDEYDVFHYPGLTMSVPSDPAEYIARLVEAFPAEREAPGFGDLIEYWEVSTPVTVTDFAAYPSGGFAELAATPERIRRRLAPTRTEVPGLYLTGSDTCSLGVTGALMGGVFTAAAVMGVRGIPRIMRAARANRSGPAPGGRLRATVGLEVQP